MREDVLSWRHVVPSPEPAELVELGTIRLLMGQGVTSSAREVVVGKDLIAALLARAVGADALLLLTDVDAGTTVVRTT